MLNLADAFPETFRGDDLLTGFQIARMASGVLEVLEQRVMCGELYCATKIDGLEATLATLRADLDAGRLQGPQGPPGPSGG